MRRAPFIRLSREEKQQLEKIVNAHSSPQAQVFRSRIILRCARRDRPTNWQVAEEFGCDPGTVSKWRSRFAAERLDGLADLPRSGRRGLFPPEDRHKVVVLATTKPADLELPISHWSLDDLAIQIVNDAHYRDMSRSTINRILNSNDLKPHRCTQWLHSDDPDFEAKALHIAQLYLDAPRLHQHGELVLCVDEKTSIQALERKYPGRPMQSGQPERREFEYIRHGTRCLIASLVVPTGQILGDVSKRRGSLDFCRHLRNVAEQFPDTKRFHWVMDNLNTHWNLSMCRCMARLSGVPFEPKKLRTGIQRRAFLTDPEHKHVIHFTPKHGSWLNQIEIWFGVLQRRVIRRGNFRSKADLTRKILDYLVYYNKHLAHPYRWTYTGQPLAA